MKVKKRQLRNKILQERGLAVTDKDSKQRQLMPRVDAVPDKEKTHRMRLVELQSGQHIEDILMGGSLSQVEKRYGIDATTASRWIKRLRLRWTEDNLPNCSLCNQATAACLVGICWKLVDTGLWDLVEVKRKQMGQGSILEEVTND